MNTLMIGIGGALGAISRYKINEYIDNLNPAFFYFGTFFVNLFGCFLIGLLFGFSANEKSFVNNFFIIGFLGSFTTMSAFTNHSISLINTSFINGFSYIIATIILCFMATYIGLNISND
tara:strand:+ start:4337 stop:4693 length:357 start_codon:yes stop_codon:yes gene_type:complete